jgi:hypothetical protein
MPEVVGAFSCPQARNERANCLVQSRNSSSSHLTQQRLELAIRQLNRVEVRRILGQHSKRCSRTLDHLFYPSGFVGWKVVHHDDIAGPELRNQALVHISQEYLRIHRTVDHHGRDHFVVTQRGHERNGLPRSKWDLADQSDTPRSPTPEANHVSADGGLVDKYQPSGIKQALLAYPTSARASDVSALSFGCLQSFF